MLDIPRRLPQERAGGPHLVSVEAQATLLAIGERVFGAWLGRRLTEAQNAAEGDAARRDVALVRTTLENAVRGTTSRDAVAIGDRSDRDLGRLVELATHLSAQLIRCAADEILARGSDYAPRPTGKVPQAILLEPAVAAIRRLRPMIRDTLVILRVRRAQVATPNLND